MLLKISLDNPSPKRSSKVLTSSMSLFQVRKLFEQIQQHCPFYTLDITPMARFWYTRESNYEFRKGWGRFLNFLNNYKQVYIQISYELFISIINRLRESSKAKLLFRTVKTFYECFDNQNESLDDNTFTTGGLRSSAIN
jgi:hypothetical protein